MDGHPDWRRNWVNPNDEAPDCDVATFERPGRSVFIERADLADLERLATERREFYVICVHLKWFSNLRERELKAALLSAWGEDAPPQSAGTAEDPAQPEIQEPQPLKGTALHDALNNWVVKTFERLPGCEEVYDLLSREELYCLMKKKREFWNATMEDAKRLRRDYASAESKVGGARYHKSRRGTKSDK
jgi:hypothetical protein